MEATLLLPAIVDSQPVTVIPAMPPIIAGAGERAANAWDEFLFAQVTNDYTRAAYDHAVRRFFRWLPPRMPLQEIKPGMIGRYFGEQTAYAAPTKKLHMAALRKLFDLLVERHLMESNPAAAVRGQRHSVVEGRTPEISVEQARTLIGTLPLHRRTGDGIDRVNVVALRDRAIIGVMFYTAARAGAVAKLSVRHLRHDGVQYSLRFQEKGNKSREIPVRDDLRQWLFEYIEAAGMSKDAGDVPLFPTAAGRTGQLTGTPMTNIDICRMVKRRLREAGLPGDISPHSFRVATITDLLRHGAALESVQHLAGHCDPRTTQLYDRRQKRVTRNLVERISTLAEAGDLDGCEGSTVEIGCVE
jgi:site-specific recombinase XerD